MNQTTRCPHCHTQFKVSPEQLEQSGGWVRCGQCHSVFDARLHIQLDDWQKEPTPAESTSTLIQPSASALHSELNELNEALDPSSFLNEPASESEPPKPESLENTLPPLVEAAAIPHDHFNVSFVQQAKRKAFWQSPLVRLGFQFALLLLTCCLLLQVFYQARHRLAASKPEWDVSMQRICSVLQCSVAYYQDIDALLITTSSFNKVHTEEKSPYQFKLNLKNTAKLKLAMPWLELSLTDANQHIVVRRVISPKDWGENAPQALAAHEELSLSTLLSITPPESIRPPSITGYKAIIFYP